jgi:hypothetical protein
VYSAADDRRAITALTVGRSGVIFPAHFTPVEGLTLAVAAGWSAVVPCGDGTNGIAGSNMPLTVDALPGGSAQRTDLIWVDVWPDDGQFALTVIIAEDASGRAGLQIGSILVPAGATNAGQMVVTSQAAQFTAGAAGPPGLQGATGATGPAGPQGPQGEQGSGVQILGQLPNTGALPGTGQPGQGYLIGGNLYVWVPGSNWVNVGSVQGPAGPQGPPGPPGTTGAAGGTGPAGVAGATGPQGPPGAQGIPGAQGAPGQTGAQGPPGPATVDTWHDLRPLTGSFAWPGGTWLPPQYRRSPDGFVDVVGWVQTPPGTGNRNNVVFANVPAGWRPSRQMSWLVTGIADGAASPMVSVNASGEMQINYSPNSLGQTIFSIFGRYPLDSSGVIIGPLP